MDRAHLGFCLAVCLEAAVCFAVPVFLLCFGLVYLPVFVLNLNRDAATGTNFRLAIALTVLGSAGMIGVVRVLVLLCRRRRQRDPLRWLTLPALACGIAAAVMYASSIASHASPTPFAVLLMIVLLPVACALHLVYLARGPLFAIGRGEP